MKQLLHLKSLLIALFVLFGGGVISATEETITFSEQGYQNQQIISEVTGSGITITFNKGTNSNAPKYYTSGTAVRAYGGNYFTVTAKGKKITEIGIGFGTSDGSNAITTDVGTYSRGTWEGEATSITFTIGGTTGHRRIASITVTYSSGQEQGKVTPPLSFALNVVNLSVGEEYTPMLTNPKGVEVAYSIDDTTIATLDDNTGYLKALKVGTTKVTATSIENESYLSTTASFTLNVTLSAKGTYEWVKDVSTLAAGNELVFVYQSSNEVAAVMGDQQTNNFKYVGVNYAESITDKSVITIPQEKAEKATSIALEGSKGAWYFNTNNGYLYAASSSSNHLKTANLETAGNNAKATISISENGNATIVFQGTNTNKNLRYNTGSSLFSCYSTGQKPIQIYRKTDSQTLPKVPISFDNSVVEITYGDNYNKQVAITDYNGKLVYKSSDENVVKFHGNNVIDVLGPGTVTITATAPATETTSESSATYTLKIHEPADAVEGFSELLNEKFDDCAGSEPKDGYGGNSSGFTTAPTSLTEAGWELSHCQAGAGFLKLTSGDGNGIVVTPTLDLNGQSEFSFEIAPWVNETATVTVSLENATFEDGIETSKSFNDLEQNTWKTKSFGIVGNGNVRIKIEATRRVFIDNFIVGGSAQPAHEINLTFGSTGYLTWVATADIDFDQTADVTAYQITEATPQGITAEEVKKAPKGAALLLKGTGTVKLERTSGVASLNGNKMLACTDASVTGITGSATSTVIYVLGNGGNGLGFYMLKNTLQAGKGYLKISGGAAAKPTYIGFEETEATNISNAAVSSEEDGVYYNLQGVRIMNPQKGIYIKNGKKIVIK